MNVLGILHVVSNLDKMVSFYTKVLDFIEVERIEWSGGSIKKLFQTSCSKGVLSKLQIGNQFTYLIEFFPVCGLPYPEDSRSNDLWFQHMAIVVSDMERAYDKLMQYGVQSISDGPQIIPAWNEAAAGIKAFYFRSPEGHPLELIYYPLGKGNPIWQKKNSLFLGIDHTAIAVKKTEASLQFYQNLLGMQIVGSSLNYGETQEKLSGVVKAKVNITSLMFPASKSMGIEFLEYLHPENGRNKPENTEAHHLIENEIIIEINDLDSLVKTFIQHDIPLLSQGIVSLENIDGFKKGCITMDPDGHRIFLVERIPFSK